VAAQLDSAAQPASLHPGRAEDLAAPQPSLPMVAAVEMGLGHLRAADALARGFGVAIAHADQAPLAGAEEQRLWRRTRLFYERVSRASQLPMLGRPVRAMLEAITRIPPLHPLRDLSHPSLTTLGLERMIRQGLGAGLMASLERSGAPLLTTFFVPALVADRHGTGAVGCVVTDTDLARAWVPGLPGGSRIRYFAPTPRAARRLAAYGVADTRIDLTGFPLPHELVGGPHAPVARANLAGRLVRLDPGGVFRRAAGAAVAATLGPETLRAVDERPPLLVFAVGGAGAQSELPAAFLPTLRPAIERGALRLALVAGVRADVARRFDRLLQRQGLAGHPGVRVVLESSVDRYFRAFNALAGEADILWTKPSELTFFASLGLPLLLAPPVGAQERYNRRWAIENGAALAQHDPSFAGAWIDDWLRDGTFAAAAFGGFTRLPKQGLYRILAAHGFPAAAEHGADSPAARSGGSNAIRSIG
jgi:hypothetical protein